MSNIMKLTDDMLNAVAKDLLVGDKNVQLLKVEFETKIKNFHLFKYFLIYF